MIFRLSDFVLDVDVERTRAFYERDDVKTTSEQCVCQGCQNYDGAILTASATVLDFLRSMGIDPRKPAEVYDVMGSQLDENGKVWYNGWYHICGVILHNESRLEPMTGAEGVAHWNNGHTHTPDPDFSFKVSFEEQAFVIHEAFPTPILQMELDAHLPWVLPTPYQT